jgi:hypothetical protein
MGWPTAYTGSRPLNPPSLHRPASPSTSSLVLGDEPLLFHTRKAAHVPAGACCPRAGSSAGAVALDHLRTLRADECGAMNDWLAVAPWAEVMHGQTGSMVSLNDMSDRALRILADGEIVELGRDKRVRHFDTPHIPHGSEAGVLYEAGTGTLFCGDLFTHLGHGRALTESDVVGPAIAEEDMFHASSLNPGMGNTIRRLAELAPRILAIMHGSSFVGDGPAALHALGDDCDRRVRAAFTR